MTKLVATIRAPGRLTVLAALMAGLSAPALAASPNLVISQIYGAGGNSGTTFYKFDYIEIFNRGSTAVTASGWSVQYGSQNSTTWSNKSPLPTFTIEPGQYLLIQEQGGTGAQAALPTPVIVPTTMFNMSATVGKVALVSDTVSLSGATPATANVVDLLGFGAANGSETAPSAPASNTLALFRAQGGCVDTDNNAADFATGAPSPRTSDSPRNSCAVAAAPIVLTCPSSLAIEQGTGRGVSLSGKDADSIVNGASITSAAVAGISLAGFTPAAARGGVASVNLQADASLAAGSYPVTIRFTNDSAQESSCSVTVAVTGVAAISQIQGAGEASPFKDQVVITEGVVTHKVGNGYFLQDAVGDGNPATSDGLFVFTSGAVNVGDLLRVRGTITEFRPTGAPRTYTEMKDVTATKVLSSGNSVTPTNINFDGTLDLARFEGMLVNINNALTINQSSFLGTRGELTLAAGRRETPTNRYRPGTPEAIALATANARNALVLDDSIFVAPTVIPYVDGGARIVRAGDTVTGLTGVIDYGSIGAGAGFKLQYTLEPSFSATNPRTGAPQLAAGNIKVASANVLNYFTTFTDGTNAWGETGVGCQLGATNAAANCRGANNMAEFERQTKKIVNEMLGIDADVFGLMEIQNNGDIATDYLVQQLNGSVGYPLYAYVPAPAATGTDAIRVSMIYKPAKVQLVGAALSDADSVNTRPPMAQTFKAGNGARFSLVVNHFHAKASTCSGENADQGDGQGCSNVRRTQQATRLAKVFIPQIISVAGDPDVLVMGDLNANGAEDPIFTLTESGLVNQLERFVRPLETPYSYVFNGEVGYLDHALATPSLSAQMTGAAEWHNNADEPTMIDYNIDGKTAAAVALIEDHAYRASDHDPVVVSMNLPATITDASANLTVQRSGLVQNRVTGKVSATITLTNISGKSMSGPFLVLFTNLTPGVSIENATGMKDGMYYITVNNATIAPGAKASFSAVYVNPNKVVFGHTNKVFTGTY
ncbi:ExeM/NucH family extracellular endonuclease [Massilia sp. TWP1-3-3]|uniref:ExeM/NucH family extracellular endonuclease n=1 Tax=Massilia sp. TWP1-3-3 TaxID=2804573 RepID=UPI003CEF35F6